MCFCTFLNKKKSLVLFSQFDILFSQFHNSFYDPFLLIYGTIE